MSNTAEIIQFRAPVEREEHRVADTDDGYVRLANELYEELIGANLTRNQAKVAHAVCRKTYGYNKKVDRIADSQLAEITRLPRQKVNKAKNELISMGVLLREGMMIGPNKNLSEWKIPECHQDSDFVTKTVTKSVTKTVTGLSPKQGHTKDTIQKTLKTDPLKPPRGIFGGSSLTSKTSPGVLQRTHRRFLPFCRTIRSAADRNQNPQRVHLSRPAVGLPLGGAHLEAAK